MSGSDYKPVESSGTLTASLNDGEQVPAKARRTWPQVAEELEMHDYAQMQ